MVSALQEQKDLIISTIRAITRGGWCVLIIDETSKKIIDNVITEDELLSLSITHIEQIETRRPAQTDSDAIYLLSPQEHIVECLLFDLERRRYKSAYLVWTALLEPTLRRRIDGSPNAQKLLVGFETLSIDYFPSESHLITFRDPFSFPILYHPQCNSLVAQHMNVLARKITGVCVSLGEYPRIRYYKPRQATHEAAVLCSHLARMVQEELDGYAQYHADFPPQSARPQGALIITDRSMDLQAPLIHEFTYQAMAYDLLPLKQGDKTYYKTVLNAGQPDEEIKEMEIGEKDDIWVKNRHTHMKDTIEKLMGDFQRFMADNPHFTNENADTTSLTAIRDMMVGLPQFQELKSAYSLHLSMAQECMNIFQQHKLPDVASVEQALATGLDEDNKKPKQMTDQLVRLLNDDSIGAADRLRLILLYILFREGVIPEDVDLLLAHSELPPQHMDTVSNLELLGGRCLKALKEVRPAIPPLFAPPAATTAQNEEYSLSRFEPALRSLLEEGSKGTLDPAIFPYTRPPLDNAPDMTLSAQGSLRSAKPTWASTRGVRGNENQQRVIVFMAGGATWSESRTCYQVGKTTGKDVFLVSSHMLTPALFVRQVSDLSVDRRRLDLPVERPRPQPPAWIHERDVPKPIATPMLNVGGPPADPGKSPRTNVLPISPPTEQLGAMTMNANGNGNGNVRPQVQSIPMPAHFQEVPVPGKDKVKTGKLEKKDKEEKKEKKHRFFGSKK